ncbi:MAG TPA: hypothetical protein VIL29_06510 [Pseudothermotoga sp.]|uniref:hypothetical protein n=1 Tax=Thermotoga profunda TaxID=1508420 RepID=UPI00059716C8|nr:hypothetical protein [Thermotoga profunda]
MEWVKNSKFLQVVLIVAILGILGWFLPFVPLKIILAFIAITILALTFKNYVRHMAGFLVLAIIIFLIPVAISSYSHIILQSFPNVFHFPYIDMLKDVPPSKTVDLKPRVVIDGLNVDIHFANTNSIRLADELDVRIMDDEIRISGGQPNKRYVIELGTIDLRDLEIDGTAVSLSGECQTAFMNIYGTAVNVKGKIIADRFSINGTGINVNGELTGKSFYADGTGINLKGEFGFETIKINGTGISIDMTLSKCRSFFIDGTGINGILVYTGVDELYIRADGTGGKITLRNRSSADIRVESSGIKIVRE